MSGIVSGVDYNVLFQGSTTSAGSVYSDLLTTLYGGGSATGGTNSTDPLTALTEATKNQTADVAKEAKDPSVSRDIAAFTKAVANSKTLKAALQNPDVLKILLTASNLADQLGFPALAQKALLSDPSDSKSLASQLSSINANWLSTVKTYNFFKNGLAELQNPKILATLTSAYTEISWRNSLDAATPGLSNALQFRLQASAVTSVDQVLGDPVNRDVVLTALNIPQQIAFQDLPAQEAEVSRYLDVKRLQDPKYVTTLTDQYLLAKQQAAQSTSSSPSLDALAVQAGGLHV
jgi:hypothetical protein